MKYKIKDSDLRQVKEMLTQPGAIYYQKVKNQKFNVGDILIKRTVHFDEDTHEIEKESIENYENSILPKRFLVIHEDADSGLYFYKSILENGKLGEDLEATYNPDDVGWNSFDLFEVDPYLLDAVILGEEFDIGPMLKEERKRKAKLIEMNKRNSQEFSSLREVNDFINSLKPGDMFYYHSESGFKDNLFATVKLKKPRKGKIEEYKKTRRWTRLSNKLNASQLNDKYVLYLRCLDSNSLITSADLIEQYVHRVRPVILKEQT